MSGERPVDEELSPESELRKVAFHEAAHAVMLWNLGIGVRRVWVDRNQRCGHAQPIRIGKDRRGRVAYAISCVAGLAVQSYLEPRPRADDTVRSFSDLHNALANFLPPGEQTDWEQLGAALALTRRTADFLQATEVKRQIYSLVPPLLRQGCLLQRQVEAILRALPESAEARRMSRRLVEELEQKQAEIVAACVGYSPDFRWNPREDEQAEPTKP